MKLEHAENHLQFFNNKFESELLKEFLTQFSTQEEKQK